MPELIPVFTRQEIEARVTELALRISEDYQDKPVILIGVLKGAFIFLSDLARSLKIPAQIDFIGASSYGSSTSSSGSIHITKKIGIDIKDRHILIVEDIVDTGLTLSHLIHYFQSFNPASVEYCALIDKQERRESQLGNGYICFSVTEGFLVGYGLDYDEQYRNLPAIYHLKF
jgi:hypoxanthine phosphoribosyltransferase